MSEPTANRHWPESIYHRYATTIQHPSLCSECSTSCTACPHMDIALQGDQTAAHWRKKATENGMRIQQLWRTDVEQKKGPFLSKKSLRSMMADNLWDAAVWNRVWSSLPVKLDMPSINYPGQPRNGDDHIIGKINVSITIHDKSITAYIIEADRRVVWFLCTGNPDEYCAKTLDDLHMSRLLGEESFTQQFLGTDQSELEENIFTGNQNQHLLASIVQIATNGVAKKLPLDTFTMRKILLRLDADLDGIVPEKQLPVEDEAFSFDDEASGYSDIRWPFDSCI